MKIRVWHGKQHDDSETTNLEVPDMHRWVEAAKVKGGFYLTTPIPDPMQIDKIVDLDAAFVPWHRINFIERMNPD